MSIRSAIIGLGHGQSFITPLRQHPRFTLVAVVDKNPELCRKISDQEKIPGFLDLEDMLAKIKLDAVFIALPTMFHAKVSCRCLGAGLHVLQEKPLCLTDEEAATIGRAVKKSGRIFQVGYEVRSSPLHQTILTHIRRGDLGEVTNVWYHQHTSQSHDSAWRLSRKHMGGKLFDCAVHYFDLMQQWAGAPVVRLAALGHLLGKTGTCRQELPESAVVAIEYANGVRGTYNFGARNKFYDDASFGIAGTTGRIQGNPIDAGRYELRQDRGVRVSQVVFDPRLTSPGHLGFREEIDNFAATILDDATNVCPFADALAAHRQMVMLDQALATGRVISARE